MSSKKSQAAIIVFLRAPELGKVKTRLAATIGDLEGLKIYRYLVETTLKNTLKTGLANYLYFYPYIDQNLSQSHPLIRARTQRGRDLGEKMFNAFEDLLSRYDRVIIVGTDCPYLSAKIIDDAFTALKEHDIVLGPAIDGGYYLIGLKRNEKRLFENIEWSTDQVLKETIARINRLDKTYYILPELGDIDFEEDWIKYLSYTDKEQL